MRSVQWVAAGVAAVSILVSAGTSRAQTQTEPAQPGLPPPTPTVPTVPLMPSAPPATEEEREKAPAPEVTIEREAVVEDILFSRTPTVIGPDLFNPPAQQGWLTIMPSFTLSGEYNDNIFVSGRNRQTDGIFGFTPGVIVSMQRPEYRLIAGYNTTGQVFVENDNLSDIGKEHQFFGDFSYRFSPRLRFTLSDRFFYGHSTNSLTAGGVSVGRQQSWRNTITPTVTFDATPTTVIGFTASHTAVRFTDDNEDDSDTVRLRLSADRRFTQRFTAGLAMNVAHFDFKNEPSAWSYTPTIGLGYDFTPTLRATVSGGPTFTDRENTSDIRTTSTVFANVSKLFKFGSIVGGYARTVTAETVGISDTQIVYGVLDVPTLTRGLRLGFIPRYSIVDRDREVTNDAFTVKTLTLSLRANYQFARYFNLIGSYTFYQQTDDRRNIPDIDQNRVFLGVQYGFPINFY